MPYVTLKRGDDRNADVLSSSEPVMDSVKPVGRKSRWGQPVRRVGNGAQMPMTADQLKIYPLIFAVPDALFPLGVVAVIVILVHRENDFRGIDYWFGGREHLPNQPVVPKRTADCQGRKISAEDTAGERKIVDPVWSALSGGLSNLLC